MVSKKKINIAITGGGCTGKSTLAAALFASLKVQGFDYDLIIEEGRKQRQLFGNYRNPFERFYMWRMQEKEELHSTATNGFITDHPLFQFYIAAQLYSSEPRDRLALDELLSMCREREDRYQLIVLAKNPCEIAYTKDKVRLADENIRVQRHTLITHFVELFHAARLLYVQGSVEQRVEKIETRLRETMGEY